MEGRSTNWCGKGTYEMWEGFSTITKKKKKR
jgi:hypothetical protein